MAKKTVNLGANANDGSGDAARTAFGKLNSNSDEMYSQLGADASGNLPTALPVSKGGTGTTSVEDLATSLETIGVGQSYQVVGGQRALDTTYTNTTGRAIFVCVLIYAKYNGGARLLCSLIFVMQFQSVHASVAIGGGWSLNLTRVENSTNIFTAFKDGFQSTVAISPSSAQVAKSLLRGGLVGLALSAVTQALLDGIDFVLDPANNSIRYKKKPVETAQKCNSDLSNCNSIKYLYRSAQHPSTTYYSSPEAVCKAYAAFWGNLSFLSYNEEYQDCTYQRTDVSWLGGSHVYKEDNPKYNNVEVLNLTTLATQIINLAEQGNPDAKAYITSVVQDMLEHDEDYRKSLEAQLDAKLKEATQTKKPNDDCPSGEYSHLGQCWICDVKDLPIITQRTQLAKDHLSSVGRCKGDMTNLNDLQRSINAFSDLISAREAENQCWSPPDPTHVSAVGELKNGIATCKNIIEKLGKQRNRGR